MRIERLTVGHSDSGTDSPFNRQPCEDGHLLNHLQMSLGHSTQHGVCAINCRCQLLNSLRIGAAFLPGCRAVSCFVSRAACCLSLSLSACSVFACRPLSVVMKHTALFIRRVGPKLISQHIVRSGARIDSLNDCTLPCNVRQCVACRSRQGNYKYLN